MYSTSPSNEPAVQVGYIPYFYEAGLNLRYAIGSGPVRKTSDHQAYSTYDFSSDLSPTRAFGSVQTVEQVIAHGYFAVPRGDPVTAIISDKKHTSRLGLDDVISQIRQRYEIYQGNTYELNQAVCEVHNSLFRQLADHGVLVANQRQQYSVTKQVQKLYEQQREERSDLWRDVSRLRLGLPETAQNYLAADRKATILKENPGDAS